MQAFTVDEHYVQNHRKRTTIHNDSDSELMEDDTCLSSSGSGSGGTANQMDDLMFPVESITPCVTPPMSAAKPLTPTINGSGGGNSGFSKQQSFSLSSNNNSFTLSNPPPPPTMGVSSSFPKSIPLNFSDGSPSFSSSHGHARKGRRLFFEETSPTMSSANNNNNIINSHNNNGQQSSDEPVFKVPGSSARVLNFSNGSSSAGSSSNNSSGCNSGSSSNSNSGNFNQYQHSQSVSSSIAMPHPFNLSSSHQHHHQYPSQPKLYSQQQQHQQNMIYGNSGSSPSSPLLSSSLPTSPVSWSFNDNNSNTMRPPPNKSFTFSYGETKNRIKPDQKAFNYDSFSPSPSPSPPPTPTPKSVNRQLEKSRAILSNPIKPYDPTDPLDYIPSNNNNNNNNSNNNSNTNGIFINTQVGHVKRQRSTSMSSPINTPTNINPFISNENFQAMLPKKPNQPPNNSINNSIDNNSINNNNNSNNNFVDIDNSIDMNNTVDIVNNNSNNNENINSLYKTTFDQISLIGEGSFGLVYKCRHRTDGCLYAVKKTKKQMKGLSSRTFVMREVYGLSAIRDHSNIVRYYNAWEEDFHIFIQMEYCGGGNLYQWVTNHLIQSEVVLLNVAKQVLNGLIHIHSLGLVHLDVKPENIYIQKSYSNGINSNNKNCNCNHINCINRNNNNSNNNNDNVNNNNNNNNDNVIYKLGDLGLLNEATDSNYFSEGDSRYLSRELLHDDMRALKKSDIFSLGCTLYELARCKPLPTGGSEWNSIRDGKLIETKDYSPDFWSLLRLMINPITDLRPSADELYNHINEMLLSSSKQHHNNNNNNNNNFNNQNYFNNNNNNNNSNEEIERLKLLIQQQSQLLNEAQSKIKEQQKIIDEQDDMIKQKFCYTNQFHKVEGDLKNMAL
ncbi:putative protein tyrosine kinase [Heterostelium album PN500]|uniref:Protein kinase domain-containing protein n=1 Tax=Heterostelium pallidum (strain ATCC 26659 / Pp 5 / PN500) TaxID=670386 RepID=D3BV64_HETP5|nr:putative protein tyrosine kinase [Heterostelium album PN500]EFA74706.1 putative protein tyrosine kinase [Heterostelium album PN500]|eukprot:XP_020426840.1 putative protein tyrosine kinase [Heterostelium album PN500]